jgi:LmbE family N-acetylglucosaminyl deacetylase
LVGLAAWIADRKSQIANCGLQTTERLAMPRILAIHAHPDDIEFQCAGTLALLRQAGCEVVMATMTPGDCGSAEHDAESISSIRRGEAWASAHLIGAEYHCLEFRDLAIFNDDDSRRRVTEFLRRIRPDIVLTAPAVDYLCDHEMTHLLVRDACFTAPIPNYVTRQWEPARPLERIPHLYFVDAIEGQDRSGQPLPAGFHVDVSAVFETKREMLACHASQRSWLLRQHGIDEYLDSQARWSRRRGAEIGVEHAEAFEQYLGHAYPHDNRLLELLGQDGKGGKAVSR